MFFVFVLYNKMYIAYSVLLFLSLSLAIASLLLYALVNYSILNNLRAVTQLNNPPVLGDNSFR